MNQNNQDLLRIYFLNVGQGDSALIVTPKGRSILIDGGPNTLVLDELDKITEYWNRKINYIVLTHLHADHSTGLSSVINAYESDFLLWNNLSDSSNQAVEFSQTLSSYAGKIKNFERGDELQIGEVFLKVLWPPKNLAYEKNLNNTSIVIHVKYRDFDCILTGDLEGSVQQLVEWPENVEVLKVAHHGAPDDTTEYVLNKSGPYIAVISVGENNFDHPSQSVLDTLSSRKITTYRTDVQGTIEVVSNGETWWVR